MANETKTAKKTFTDEQWNKLNLEQKIQARKDNAELTEAQADNLEAEEDAKYHLDMLKKQSSTRVAAGLRVLRSIGEMGIHNPTPEQRKAIETAIDNAVKEMKESLAGKPKVAFQLPV